MWIRRAELRRILAQLRDSQNQSVALRDELREERERSRRREDELVDRVLLASGRHSLTPEPKAKATPIDPPKHAPLTALDEARLLALRQAAVDAGRPPQEADLFLKAEREGKPFSIGLPDEPYVLPT